MESNGGYFLSFKMKWGFNLRISAVQPRQITKGLPSHILFNYLRIHIFLVNSRAARLFGYTGEKLLGMCLEDLPPERYRGCV